MSWVRGACSRNAEARMVRRIQKKRKKLLCAHKKQNKKTAWTVSKNEPIIARVQSTLFKPTGHWRKPNAAIMARVALLVRELCAAMLRIEFKFARDSQGAVK